MNIWSTTTNFPCDSTKKQTNKKGLPCGVQEAFPCDAVSRCCWRNKPESRSAAPINLPLKPIITVFHWNKHRRKKSTEVLLTLDIYSRNLIIYSAETEPQSDCSPTEYIGGGLGLKKLSTVPQLREFEIWCFMYQTSKAEKALCVFTQTVITPWQSQRDPSCSFHHGWGIIFRCYSWEVSVVF